MIADALDGSIVQLVLDGTVIWMPAHTAGGAIGTAVKSDGTKVTTAQWRANQLADALAKKGAPQFEANIAVDKLFSDACAAAQQAASLLGTVTHAANNYKTTKVKPDGTSYTLEERDCTGPPKKTVVAPPRTANLAPATAVVVGAQPASSDSEPPTPRRTRVARASTAAATERKAKLVTCTASAIAYATANSKPSGSASASERLAAVKRRLSERLTGKPSEPAEVEGATPPEGSTSWGTFLGLTSEAV